MKPLLANNLNSFMERFDNFRNGEFRSIEVVSPTTITITLAGQDSARSFDWISMKFEFSGVSDAQLLENSKLSFVDMCDGISIINTDDLFAFGLGKCYNISNIKSSACHIVSSSLKYEEGLF
jgi:hypothetical protein